MLKLGYFNKKYDKIDRLIKMADAIHIKHKDDNTDLIVLHRVDENKWGKYDGISGDKPIVKYTDDDLVHYILCAPYLFFIYNGLTELTLGIFGNIKRKHLFSGYRIIEG